MQTAAATPLAGMMQSPFVHARSMLTWVRNRLLPAPRAVRMRDDAVAEDGGGGGGDGDVIVSHASVFSADYFMETVLPMLIDILAYSIVALMCAFITQYCWNNGIRHLDKRPHSLNKMSFADSILILVFFKILIGSTC